MALAKYKTIVEFMGRFNTERACLEYLVEQKWSEGYHCRKCGHQVPVKGRKWHYRRCQKCGHDESATANTLFHKIKFPLVEAFLIVYQLSTMKKGLSTCELSRQYSICQKTAWFFKRKVQAAIASKKDALLADNVEVDEFVVGGLEAGRPGRSKGKKAKVLVAVEIAYPDDRDGPVIKRAEAEVIESYDAEELGRGIDEMVDEQALVVSDGWSAYPKAVGKREHLAFPSAQGRNFPLLHFHIFNLKNWLRGTHHSVSQKHLQKYLDEYHYRFNRRGAKASCPMGILRRMTNAAWLPYIQAIAN
jgi:hypothetical protein